MDIAKTFKIKQKRLWNFHFNTKNYLSFKLKVKHVNIESAAFGLFYNSQLFLTKILFNFKFVKIVKHLDIISYRTRAIIFGVKTFNSIFRSILIQKLSVAFYFLLLSNWD